MSVMFVLFVLPPEKRTDRITDMAIPPTPPLGLSRILDMAGSQ